MLHIVHIKLQRVQTWLFAVPRLRAMVGANALLGRAIRTELRDFVISAKGYSTCENANDYPEPHPDDPLASYDNPRDDAEAGILSRDGGHFEACFADESGANRFAEAASIRLDTVVPGLRYAVSVDGKEIIRNCRELSIELPVLAPCQWTGRGVASLEIHQGADRYQVALEVSRRHDAAKYAGSGRAEDLASRLMAAVRPNLNRPETFEELAGPGYMAVVHADGNGVGESAPKEASARAKYHHRNRVLLRRALRAAIQEVCPETGMAPLIPLMLGGDDLLVLCRAKIALNFVEALCRNLEVLQQDRGNDFYLTLGVGIVFAKPSVPFHRLHAVAENLASSAKRRFRGLPERERASIADWTVYTTAWADDPADMRRRDWVCGSKREPAYSFTPSGTCAGGWF